MVRLARAVGRRGIIAVAAAGLLVVIGIIYLHAYSEAADAAASVRPQRAIRRDFQSASKHLDNVVMALMSQRAGDGRLARALPIGDEWTAAAGRFVLLCQPAKVQASDAMVSLHRLCADFAALEAQLTPIVAAAGDRPAALEADLQAALLQFAIDVDQAFKRIEASYAVRYGSLIKKLEASNQLALWSAGGFLIAGLIFFLLFGQAATRHQEASQAAARAQERAQGSAQRLLDAIGALPVGFALYDRDERLVMYNKTLADTVPGGYVPSDLGKTVEEILDRLIADWRQQQPNDDFASFRARHLAHFRQFLGPRDEVYDANRALRLNESRTHDGGTVVIRMDISENKKREAALLASEQRYDDLVNSLRDIVFSLDRQIRFTYLSASVMEMFGYDPEEVRGRSVLEYIHYDDLAQATAVLTQALAQPGTPGTLTCRLRGKDDTFRTVETRLVAPIARDNSSGDLAIAGIARDIEAQQRMQRQLGEQMEAARRSERRYVGLVSSLKDPVFSVNRDGRFTYASDQVADLLGYAPGELLGRAVMELFHPDDQPQLAAFMADMRRRRGVVITDTFRLQRKDGSYLLGEIRASATEKRDSSDGEFAMTGIAHDVGAERAMEQALHERMERLNSIVQSTGALFVLLDRDLKIVMANTGFQDFIGKREEDIVDRALDDVIASPLDASVADAWLAAEPGETLDPAVRDASLPGRNGQARDFRFTMNAVRGNSGRVEHIVVLGVDETERRQTELRLIDTSRLATLGEMATGIAHEINQPLATISLAAEAIVDELPCDNAALTAADFRDFLQQQCNRIVAQTQRASTIIRDLRGFARKPDETPIPLDIAPTLRAVAGMVGEQLRLAGVRLDYDIDSACRPVAGHASRLQQVIINLVINARDAILERSPVGGGIVIRARELDGANKAVITVDDDGPGIPDHALPRLFEPFYTTKPTGRGTGLGLSISYQIIRQMGGTIVAQNRTEGGARFTVTLNLAPATPLADVASSTTAA